MTSGDGAHAGPAAEIDVHEDLVRSLLAEQHPDLAGRPLTLVANGWDNVIFRLGDDLTVRLPRRALAAPLVEHELRWLPELATRLPLPIAAPVRSGAPGPGYPWSWIVGRWFPGATAAEAPLTDPGAGADALGGFLAALHVPAPVDAPVNPWRGIPLAERDEIFRRQIAALDAAEPDLVLDDGRALVPAAVDLWESLVQTPTHAGPPVWLHGDLHPANLIVDHGSLAAVIDFGDLCSGDPAGDLSAGWMLLPTEHHARFRAAAGGGGGGDPSAGPSAGPDAGPSGSSVDDATWQRARAWALTLAIAILAGSGPFSQAPLRRVAHQTLARVLADHLAAPDGSAWRSGP